jgi:phosphoglycerol transferase MdoB-like AlkP superfamily enzyme
VVDYIAIVADIALFVSAFIGTYYAFESSRLFKGDFIMEKVWRLATVAFVITAFFSVLDFILTAENGSLAQYHFVRIGAVFAIAIFVVAVMLLVGWGRSSMESRTRPSRQSVQ